MTAATTPNAGPRSDRLLYRRLEPDDLPALVAYRSHPEFLRFYEAEAFDEASGRAFLQRFRDWEAESPQRRHAYAVVETADAPVIGVCSIRRENASDPWAEIGFELAVDRWGRGYGVEMAEALLAFGFGDLGLHRIQAHCVADNEASARLLRRIGMREEGRLREKHRFKGRFWDELWFGILRPEWEARRVGALG